MLKIFNNFEINCAPLKVFHQRIKEETLHEPSQDIEAKVSGVLAFSVQQNASCATWYYATSSYMQTQQN